MHIMLCTSYACMQHTTYTHTHTRTPMHDHKVYDISRRDTFNHLTRWLEEARAGVARGGENGQEQLSCRLRCFEYGKTYDSELVEPAIRIFSVCKMELCDSNGFGPVACECPHKVTA